MTPLQTFGGAAAPSNMQFPTAAYLQASQNAADMQMRGQEALGKGIAQGISGAASGYMKHKEEQGKFDATKKVFKAFESFLPEETRGKISSIFSDTSMSVSEKNAMAPMLLSFLAQAQQQQGKESIANIMTQSKEAIAADKNPSRPLPLFDATQGANPLGQVAGQAYAEPAPAAVPFMIQSPETQPNSVQRGPLSNMPKTRQDPQTGRMQFWSPGAKRYIDESENDLIFGSDFRIQ